MPLAGPGAPGARHHLSGDNGVCPRRPVPAAEPFLVCTPSGGPSHLPVQLSSCPSAGFPSELLLELVA